MDTAFDILQALGIGAAVGIRPFLPALLVGALAAADLGVDFDGTDWSFLEEAWFLLAMLVGVAITNVVPRRELILLAAGFIAVLLGAGSVADHGGPVAVGMLVALLAATLAIIAVSPVFERVKARLGSEAGLLPLYREAAALVAAGVSVLFPPLAVLVVAGLVFLLAGGRRREGEKYAGLRILR